MGVGQASTKLPVVAKKKYCRQGEQSVREGKGGGGGGGGLIRALFAVLLKSEQHDLSYIEMEVTCAFRINVSPLFVALTSTGFRGR